MKVSICIATYNSSSTIRYTLNSILKQTYQDFEVVIVDDHSTDGTVNIISNEYCMKDNRFKLFINMTDVNKPYIDAFNKSYQIATGELLFRIDHDDILLPQYLEHIVNYMIEHPEVDSCNTRLIFYDLIKQNNDYSKIDINNISNDILEENYIKNYNVWMTLYDICPPAINHWAAFVEDVVLIHNPASCMRKIWYDAHKPSCKFFAGGDMVFWREVIAMGANHKILNLYDLIYVMHSSNTHFAWKKSSRINEDDEEHYVMNNLYMYYITYYTYKGLLYYPDDLVVKDGTTVGTLKNIMYNTILYYKNELLKQHKFELIPDEMKL